MKRVLPFVLVLMVLATSLLSRAQNNAATEKAVADLEQQWLKSQQTNNVGLVEPLLADGFTSTSSEGEVSATGLSL